MGVLTRTQPEQRGRPRERAPGPRRIEGRPGDWPRPADPARVPRLGVALRARAGAARTAVPAPPPQSAPRSARTCRRAAPSPAPSTPSPREPPRRAIAGGRRRSHWAEARALHPGLPLRQPLRRRRARPGDARLGQVSAGGRGGHSSHPGWGRALGAGLGGGWVPSPARVRVRGRAPGLSCRAWWGQGGGEGGPGRYPHAVSHLQLGPGPGLSFAAAAAEPAARVLLQPGFSLAAFPRRPVLEPWGPPSPCLPGCPGPGTADLGCRGSVPPAPLPASAARDPG